MKKTQIIAPWVAIAIAAVVWVVLSGIRDRGNNRRAFSHRVGQIGVQLARETNSPALVTMPTELYNTLTNFLGTPARVDSISYDKADVCLFLKNESGERLGIRLKWDSERVKFHVLGYWMTETRSQSGEQ